MSKKEALAATNDLEQQGGTATAEEAAPGADTAAEGAATEIQGTVEETTEELIALGCRIVPPQSAKGVNLRPGPGTQFGVLQILEAGHVVGVLELPLGVKVPGWVLATAGDDLIGWLDSRYVQPVEG